MTPTPQTLFIGEAVELLHAWVQRLADERDLRVLFIKGPALHRLGLRAARGSSDTDVLVSPRDFERMRRELPALGWYERDLGFLMGQVPLHSRTFIAEGWPCDLDVHAHFPGFLVDPDTVFEALWARRSTITFAGRPCMVPDRVSSTLILALHSLRSSGEQRHHDDELAWMLGAAFTPAERVQVGELAAETGCVETLGDVLPRLGVAATTSSAPIDADALLAWKQRTAVRDNGLGTYDLLRALRAAPTRLKPMILFRAIWPSDDDLRALRPGLPAGTGTRTGARIARLANGLSALPGVLASIWRNRREAERAVRGQEALPARQ